MNKPSFVKQYQEISFNLFLDIFDLTIKIPDRFAKVQTSLLQFENYRTQQWIIARSCIFLMLL